MKFQQLSAFEKHLEKASPDHLSRVYFVVAPCAFERKKISESICAAIQKKENKIAVLSFDGNKDLVKIREELETVCLVGGCRVVILDEVDTFKKGTLTALSTYIIKPSVFTYLILSAAKNLPEFYEHSKKELVICDLSAEKPWERKERLKAHLIKLASKEGKAMTREATDMLMERIGTELPQLEQEMYKLLCYCLDRPQITGKDVQVLCASEKTASVWQLAESIVWQEHAVNAGVAFESASFLYLLGQVRAHLQQGLQLSLYLEQGKSLREIVLPFFKPQLLEKIAPIAQMLSPLFFQKALTILFEMEMLAKNSGFSAVLLLDLLVAKIHIFKQQVREKDVISFT